MKAGTPRRANAAQIGSSSGSSILSRDPSALRLRSPNDFGTSPTPTAPAFRSASSCATAGAPQPGPTLLKLIPANTRKRSLYGLALIACIARVSRSPDELSALTSTFKFSLSISDTTAAIDSAVVSDGGCPWMSIEGNFDFGTRCAAETSVDLGR